MSKSKISIVVPVYNVEPYIEDCLKSVGMQQYDGELECIVVDDCGTDKSIEIAREYVENYNGKVKFKIVAHEHNRGLSAARNTGVGNSKGDYIIFIDSDDEMLPGAIETITAPLNNKVYDFVIADYVVSGTDAVLPRLYMKEGAYNNVIESFTKCLWYVMAYNKLVRREFLLSNQIHFEEGIIHEDELWSFMVAIYANSMYVLNVPTYHYKVRSGSITTGRNVEVHLAACSKIFARMIEIAQNLPAGYDLCNINDYIQGRLHRWFEVYNGDGYESLRRNIYIEMRRRIDIRPSFIFRCNNLKPRRNLRDIHLLLPSWLGWWEFKWWKNGSRLNKVLAWI